MQKKLLTMSNFVINSQVIVLMKMIWIAVFITAFLSAGLLVELPAQDLRNIDFASVNVDNLSDGQILQIWERAQEENMGVQEIGVMAQNRGMSATEVAKLRTRINQARFRSISETGENIHAGTLRQGETESPDRGGLIQERGSAETRSGLQVFGNSLFRDRAISFEPSINIPTPVDYTLGVGDEIVINIWGAAEANYQLTINPEGVVRIPNLGPIQLDGLSILDARIRILNRLQNIYSGLRPDQPETANTFAEVSLGNVRSIKVTIMGEVSQPGTYTLSSLSTVFNALYAAGGPTDSGTFRNIQIIRGLNVVATLDIYDFLVYGDQSDNIRLRDQDVIKIDPYINKIQLSGEVKRPGIFELKKGETLANLIEYSAGFTEQAFTRRLVLRRTTDIQRTISDVNWPEGSDMVLRGGDVLHVGQLLERFDNRVEIRGAVFRGGEYELTEGMTLTDLIAKAEGLREDAYMQRGVITRMGDGLRIESIAFSMADIQDGVSRDILLTRDDIVRISSLFDLQEEYTIQVNGAVNSSGEFDFRENLTLSDAIFLADGFRESAAPYRVEVARRMTGLDRFSKGDQLAERFEFEVDTNLQFREGDEDFVLKPFDQIFIRRQPNYREQQSVVIQGEVNFPGNYVLEKRNARISDLISWSGGLSDYAYPEGASLTRRQDRTEEAVLELDRADEFVQIRQNGNNKVGIRLIDILRNPGGPHDLKLVEGDILEIPQRMQTVRVAGEVLFPVNIRYDSGMSLRDAVNRAGGFTERARRSRAYVVYANGEVDRSKRILFFRNHPKVEPGSTIVIPREEDREQMTTQERVMIYSTIISLAAIVTNTIFQIRR